MGNSDERPFFAAPCGKTMTEPSNRRFFGACGSVGSLDKRVPQRTISGTNSSRALRTRTFIIWWVQDRPTLTNAARRESGLAHEGTGVEGKSLTILLTRKGEVLRKLCVHA